ncbi:hypothetical protein JQ629_24745 [Bradyrhizobium sp. AUGA SZCCT0222]|uniref:hypothetical protein n=1 Tax=Bradyrhizobium sp. AUGA SZCCT0222 TaxID=2807668 RepID=UPI001BA939AC|nr:hypothetical protein [Bradyrhizobium sp. AUGA SZCCT0222]MBR1270687.1 hypothetical protein [Bradyrhizobium sp. AUGA SZCCT0222]
MESAKRIVTLTPLNELWNSNGRLDARRAEEVGETDIARLLQAGSSFVVADVGHPLQWISDADRFAFWETEVKCRLVPPDVDGFHPDDYPGSYCYVATMWKGASTASVVVLEKHH